MQAKLRAAALFLGLIGFSFLVAFAMTGCSEMKYAECIARDRTSNPCN